MRKVIKISIIVVFVWLLGICVMVGIDSKASSDIEKRILKNTDIEKINNVSVYDNYYIVSNADFLYLLDSKYEEVFKVDMKKVHENKNHYAFVYRDDTILYMDTYENKEGIVFKYYDIYSYKLVDTVVVGGN